MDLTEIKKEYVKDVYDFYDGQYSIVNKNVKDKLKLLGRSALLIFLELSIKISNNKTTRIIINLPDLAEKTNYKDFRTIELALEELNNLGFFLIRPLESELEYIVFTDINANKKLVEVIENEQEDFYENKQAIIYTTTRTGQKALKNYLKPKKSKMERFKSSIIKPLGDIVKKHCSARNLQGFVGNKQSCAEDLQSLAKVKTLECTENIIVEASQKSSLNHSSLNLLSINHSFIEGETVSEIKNQEVKLSSIQVKNDDDDSLKVFKIKEEETLVKSEIIPTVENKEVSFIPEEQNQPKNKIQVQEIKEEISPAEIALRDEIIKTAKSWGYNTIEKELNTNTLELFLQGIKAVNNYPSQVHSPGKLLREFIKRKGEGFDVQEKKQEQEVYSEFKDIKNIWGNDVLTKVAQFIADIKNGKSSPDLSLHGLKVKFMEKVYFTNQIMGETYFAKIILNRFPEGMKDFYFYNIEADAYSDVLNKYLGSKSLNAAV